MLPTRKNRQVSAGHLVFCHLGQAGTPSLRLDMPFVLACLAGARVHMHVIYVLAGHVYCRAMIVDNYFEVNNQYRNVRFLRSLLEPDLLLMLPPALPSCLCTSSTSAVRLC